MIEMQKCGKVLVVGAGPTGMLLALLLSNHGISVEIVEAEDHIDQRPRGIAYGSAAVRVLRQAGVLEDVRLQGISYNRIAWRRHGGKVMAEMNTEGNSDPGQAVAMPVHRLTELLMSKLPATTKIHWKHKVVDVDSDEQCAWLDVESGGAAKKRMTADFVVGCDGAKSAVRHALFGHDFPGMTWSQGMIVLNIYYDIEKYGWHDAQWTIDKDHWAVVCRIDQQKGFWRVCYGENPELSVEEQQERLPEKLKMILPGNPDPNQYKVVRFSPFVMHNRCAKRMAVGRVLLAGDAAHLVNPMGGLGLTGGMADVGAVFDSLAGIFDGKASLAILDKYDEIRRGVFNNLTDKMSIGNFNRVLGDADDVAAHDPLILGLASQDEEFIVKMREADAAIGSDMTKFYDLQVAV